MTLTLANFQTTLPKPLLKKADKLAVRECDEISKGTFVAYVDDKEESYDVKLSFNTGSELEEHSCDCSSRTSICVHKAALLLHLTRKVIKNKTGIKKAKKKTKAEALLESIESEHLKTWLGELFARNKEVELSFTHHFTAAEKVYDPAEVERITKEAIKAVIKNRSDINRTSVKQLVSLWTTIHAPIIKAYLANVTDKAAFLNYHTLMESCITFDRSRAMSKYIEQYINGLLLQSYELISALENDDAWSAATGHFLEYLAADSGGLRTHYLLQLHNFAANSTPARSSQLTKAIIENYKSNKRKLHIEDRHFIAIFNMAMQYYLPADYPAIFKPLLYQDAYNEALIQLLVRDHHLALAEKYCLEQIAGNSGMRLLPYLSQLKEIYTTTKNENGIARVTAQLFPLSFNFADYQYLTGRMTEEEKKTWRTKALSKARNAQSHHPAAEEFCFLLSESEGTYKKMITYIRSPVSYRLVARYIAQMLSANKDELLRALLFNGNNRWGVDAEDEASDLPYLVIIRDQLLKHFTLDGLTKIIRQTRKESYYYSDNRLVGFLGEELGM